MGSHTRQVQSMEDCRMSRLAPITRGRLRAPSIKQKGRLQWVAGLGCWKCGRPAQACHLRTASAKYGVHPGGANRTSDWFTTPMCVSLHDLQHGMNEMEFWAQNGISDPYAFALAINSAHPNDGKALEIIQAWTGGAEQHD